MPESAWDVVKGAGDTRAGTIDYNCGHQRDHCGRLVAYLRMNGHMPSASQGAPPANRLKQ